jgi:hypothetical protein
VKSGRYERRAFLAALYQRRDFCGFLHREGKTQVDEMPPDRTILTAYVPSKTI